MAVTRDKNLKKNPWYFTIEVNNNGNRERIKRRGFKRKQDAEEAQRALLNELGQGLDLDASKTLYSDYLQDWLRDKKTKVKRGTLTTYASFVNNHIIPAMGNLKLSEITPRHIQNFYNDLTETGTLCGENIQKVHTIIKGTLGRAAGWDMIIKNPATVVDRPQFESKEMMYWTDEQSHRFLKAAKQDRYYHAFLLAITTGMRQGEILGLEWKDVDFVNRTISVRQILNHDGKELEHGTKTISGMRSIGIDKVTANELENLRKRTKEDKMSKIDIYTENGLVICTQTGSPLSPRNLNRSFERLVANENKRALKDGDDLEELTKIRFHDLRHTHVVMLLKMRENNKRIAERMGWASVKMLDRYSHVTAHMQQETADAFGEMFFSAPNGTTDALAK